MRCRHDGRVTGYCIYTSISSHVRGCSHGFFFAGSQQFREKVKGRTTHGGRPGSASSTWRTTRETSSSRSSLSAPACARPTSLPPFFPTGLKRTVENLRDIFLALYMFSVSVIFQDLRISSAVGFLVRRDPPFRACCACSPLWRTKGSRRWLGLQE